MDNILTGILIVNKPYGISSMGIIKQVRRLTGIKKVGHAGTLDPLATGVLVVCISREATKHIDSLMATTKEYVATIDLAHTSTTDDAEGELSQILVDTPPSKETVETVLKEFVGTIEQTPPIHSAIHVNGQRAYKLARKGVKVELKSRLITIDAIELLSYEWPSLTIRVTCQKGTYIRSLARDIGTKLSTGGYLTGLIRTKVGAYHIDKAIDLDKRTSITQTDLLPISS